MKNILGLALGVMTALGGFVDIGELVFTTQAGARFGYRLIWAVVLGTIGIIVFSEMCGRVAAISERAVFDTVRDKLGYKLGLVTLVASNFVNLITCAAEIGGVAIVLRLLSGMPYRSMLLATVFVLIAIIWFTPFKGIENFFGLAGLLMLIFVWVAIRLHPDWHAAAAGLLPRLPAADQSLPLYLYFVVGIISSVMMPYEVYFYSSGAIEEGWQVKDLKENTFICNVGFSLGSLLSISILLIGAAFFRKFGIIPELLGTSAMSAPYMLGRVGLIIGLLGFLFCIGGSAVETCLAGAYNTCQFFGQRWGRHLKPRQTPVFTTLWIIIFLLALGIVMTGIDPVQLVEYSVIFAVVVLPLTYLPILLVSKDKKYMGKHVNSRVDSALGWIFFVVATICALAAIPLMIITKMGKG